MVTKGGIQVTRQKESFLDFQSQARVWKKGMEVKVEYRKKKDLLDLIGQNGLFI